MVINEVCDDVEKVNFDVLIDGLNENSLRDFHSKLIENRCYETHLKISDVDINNLEQLRRAVKIGVQSTDYEKLKQFAPITIKTYIESLSDTIQPSKKVETEAEVDEKTTAKEKLIQELLQITSQRDKRKRIPPLLRPRYEVVVTQLNKVHNMTFLEISNLSGMDRQTLSKDVDSYLKEHPIVQPDEAVLRGSEKRVTDKLTKVVGATADKIIEDDMELAIHIRQNFLKEAYIRGMSLRQLVDAAIPLFFRIEDVYTIMIGMEQEIIELRTRNVRLTAVNRSLSRTLININSFSGGYNG